MTEQQAMLESIRQMPDDDVRRLVYADWLNEHPFAPCTCNSISLKTGGLCERCEGTGNAHHGYAERERFIRVQCEIAAHNHGERQSSDQNDRIKKYLRKEELRLWGRVRNFVQRECDSWWPMVLDTHKAIHLDPEVFSGHLFAFRAFVRRGFIDEVRCSLASWLGMTMYGSTGNCPAIGPAIAQSQPLSKVRFTECRPLLIPGSTESVWLMANNGTRIRPNEVSLSVWIQMERARHFSSLPLRLFQFLPGRREPDRYGIPCVRFPTVESANDAISTAAILWARNQQLNSVGNPSD